jgi:hypothetical protein
LDGLTAHLEGYKKMTLITQSGFSRFAAKKSTKLWQRGLLQRLSLKNHFKTMKQCHKANN